MNCYLKKLSQITILTTVLQQFCKRFIAFETIVYSEEILILALDKALPMTLCVEEIQIFVERNYYQPYQIISYHNL